MILYPFIFPTSSPVASDFPFDVKERNHHAVEEALCFPSVHKLGSSLYPLWLQMCKADSEARCI